MFSAVIHMLHTLARICPDITFVYYYYTDIRVVDVVGYWDSGEGRDQEVN